MILGSEAETAAAGAAAARSARGGDVITLSGPLGVGKTAFARGFIAELGHEGEVPSPSFAIVQPYDDVDPPVWHVDLFRIDNSGELDELGLDAAADGVLLVEWPDKANNRMWSQALGLTLEFGEGTARRLTANVPPSWQSRWPLQ